MKITSKEIRELIKECDRLPCDVAECRYKNGSYSSSTGYVVSRTAGNISKRLELIYEALYEMEMREKVLAELTAELRLSVTVK